jgi:hypothetical protein
MWRAICQAIIEDAAGNETPCECSVKTCPDGLSTKPYITCGEYKSGAVADACMDNWGVQGGILQALSIKTGLCVVAVDADTISRASPSGTEPAPVDAPRQPRPAPVEGSLDAAQPQSLPAPVEKPLLSAAVLSETKARS